MLRAMQTNEAFLIVSTRMVLQARVINSMIELTMWTMTMAMWMMKRSVRWE